MAKIRKHCQKADVDDLKRRLPAWSEVSQTNYNSEEKWILRVADLIDDLENGKSLSNLGPQDKLLIEEPGAMIFNPYLGITALWAKTDSKHYYLIDLSRGDNRAGVYGQQIRTVFMDGKPGKFSWHDPCELAWQEH